MRTFGVPCAGAAAAVVVVWRGWGPLGREGRREGACVLEAAADALVPAGLACPLPRSPLTHVLASQGPGTGPGSRALGHRAQRSLWPVAPAPEAGLPFGPGSLSRHAPWVPCPGLSAGAEATPSDTHFLSIAAPRLGVQVGGVSTGAITLPLEATCGTVPFPTRAPCIPVSPVQNGPPGPGSHCSPCPPLPLSPLPAACSLVSAGARAAPTAGQDVLFCCRSPSPKGPPRTPENCGCPLPSPTPGAQGYP